MGDVRTLKLELRYDGTDFFGWQVQPDRRTVQGELARALVQLLEEPVRLAGAGRTDAGVHALHQVVSFSTARTIPADALRRALNACLPSDVQVDRVTEAPADFHARFSATRRAYRYHVSGRVGPILRRYSWCLRRLPDRGVLQEATVPLLGRHDFTSFSGREDEGVSPICEVARADWQGRRQRLWFDIAADRFLNRMVRTVVGTLLALERQGELTPAVVAEILAARDRTKAPRRAPAAGLFLVGVTYPEA